MIGIAIGLLQQTGRAVHGMVTGAPLSAPRRLSYVETTGNPGHVDFSWQAPASWGDAGPHGTDRYQYEFRLEGSGGTLNPWSGVLTNHNAQTARVPWAAAHQHPPNRVQFRVRARDANGATSGWLTSPVLTERAVNPPPPVMTGRSRFAGRWAGRFG